MGGLDAPWLRIEVVGAITDILDGSQRNTLISDGDDAARGVGRQCQSLATEIFQGVRIGEIYSRMVALWQIWRENF